MIHTDCMNYDGDEDANKCCKHGYIFGCDPECEDYVNFFGYDIHGKKKGE